MGGAATRRAIRRAAALAAVVATGTGLACAQRRVETPARHLILVTLDTLRADHVGVYGASVETPNLDRLAAEGAMGLRVSTHVPLTRPAHVSLFSGRLPPETGIRDNVSPAKIPAMPLLAEVARDAGFRTAAFVSSIVLSSASGLDRGFEIYSEDFEVDPLDPGFLNSGQRRGDETLAAAITWLEANRQAERLFLWLHLYDPHDPYEPPEPWAGRYPDDPYAGEVAWTDDLVGRLDSTLRRLGLAAESLLIVTSDHGEGLGDHDERLHGFFVYESTLAVPLLARGPGIRPGLRLEGPIGLVDLMPTALELLDLEPPPGAVASGRSLAGALRGAAEGEAPSLYAETLVPLLQFGWSDLRVLRRGDLKYIQAPRPELYDLAADPGETDNLLARGRPGAARELREALGDLLDAERAGPAAGGEQPAAVSEDLLARLGALGYLGGTAPADTPTPGADPKDKIEEFRLANDLMRRGLARLHEGNAAAAAGLFARLLERGIESAELHLYLARALADLGRFAEAVEHYEATVDRTPLYQEAWLGLATALEHSRGAAAALAALERGRTALPRNAELRVEEARRLRLVGRLSEAREALVAAVALGPDDPFSHAALAELERDLGNLDAAIAAFRRATELAPDEASYWNALGMTLGGAGRLEDSVPAFRRALDLDGSNPQHAYNLGLALLRLGRSEEARRHFETALRLAPGFKPARRSERPTAAAGRGEPARSGASLRAGPGAAGQRDPARRKPTS